MADLCYEQHPLGVVVAANAVALATYAAALAILARLAMPLAVLGILYCVWLEYRVLAGSCAGCYYYGRRCAFGKGKLAPRIVERADAAAFASRTATWSDLAPELALTLFPLLSGIALLAARFDWTLAGLLAALVLLSTAGNAMIRGRFACRHCKQREIGCPAQKLFAHHQGSGGCRI